MSLRDDAEKYRAYNSRHAGLSLADHVLRETDPSPVTMEAMRERGFYCRYMTNEMAHDKIPGDFCCDNGQCQWVIGGSVVSVITSIGQLDTLLRGLGCAG